MGSISIFHWLIVLAVIAALTFDWRRIYDWYLNRRFVRKFGIGVVSPEVVESWMPPAKYLTVPLSFHTNMNFDTYMGIVKFRTVAMRYFRFAAIASLISYVGYIIMIGISPDNFRNLSFAFFLPLTIAALFVTFKARERTIRVLLLRPFGEKTFTKSMKKIVSQHIGTLGNEYTLSDRNYRQNFLVTIVLRYLDFGIMVLGPILRPSPRIARVKTERTFLNLARMLGRRIGPSLRNFVVGGQAFNVKSTNEWWKLTIDLLMNSSEMIVMDISNVGPGSEWEINNLNHRDLLHKAIFISHYEKEDYAAGVLRRILGENGVHIYTYREGGQVVEERAFVDEIHRQVRQALGNILSSHRSSEVPIAAS